jgi:hypothetical protein
MAISFTTEEKHLLKCNIFDQNIDPQNLDEPNLPTDIHLVEYEIDGTLYVDSVRAYKKVDIFDPYYDKLSAIGGKLISITNGYGRIKPKLFQK